MKLEILILMNKNQFKLEGWRCQKQGVGEALVRAAESFCANQKTSIIWFNARTSAVGFYKKMGYEVTGSEFKIKEVGPHFLMYKKI